MDSELRIAIDEQVNVVRHDLHLDNPRVSFAARISDDNLKVGFNASNQQPCVDAPIGGLKAGDRASSLKTRLRKGGTRNDRGSSPPPAPRRRVLRPRAAGRQPGAQCHQQGPGVIRLRLINQVDRLADHVPDEFLIERADLWVVLPVLETLIADRSHERLGAIRRRQVYQGIDLAGDSPQRGRCRTRACYLAHLLHPAPYACSRQNVAISSSRQTRRNHGIERTRGELDLILDFCFVTQV
jgi:hypothetical protein